MNRFFAVFKAININVFKQHSVMEVKLAREVEEKVSEVSVELGIKRNEVIERAVLLYLDNISKYLELKKEFSNWDKLSDEALIDFEKQL